MPLVIPRELSDRRNFTDGKIAEVRKRIEGRVPGLTKAGVKLSEVCIYATGSFGRHEAGEASDIDIFIVDAKPQGARYPDDSTDERSLGNIDELRLKTALVEICTDEMELPEFDGDGRFLDVHLLTDILGALGGTHDDAKNYFTARLLLLLESQPLYNPDVYATVVDQFLAAYYRDYSGQPRFVPTYLINDVTRYWKTLCLNYEHRRRAAEEEAVNERKLEDTRLANRLKARKLTFSRIMTCFSTLTSFAYRGREAAVTAEFVKEVVYRTPTQRLEDLARDPDLEPLVQPVLDHYAWFLEKLGIDKDSAKRWLRTKKNDDEARRCAREYRDAFYRLLLTAGAEGQLVTYITM